MMKMMKMMMMMTTMKSIPLKEHNKLSKHKNSMMLLYYLKRSLNDTGIVLEFGLHVII